MLMTGRNLGGPEDSDAVQRRSAAECLTETEVEDFVFDRLEPGVQGAVEEHLLVCEGCRQRVEEEQEFAQALKDSTRLDAAGDGHFEPSDDDSGMPAPWRRPAIWLAAIAAVLILAVYVVKPGRSTPPEDADVTLRALRGALAAEGAAQVNQRLILHIERAGLPDLPAYRLALVNLDGKSLRSAILSGGEIHREELVWRLGETLPAGSYWVRVSDGGGAPLRECALTVR
jgi:hypothetical protein